MMPKIVITVPLGATLKILFLNQKWRDLMQHEFSQITLLTPLKPEDIAAVLGEEDSKHFQIIHIPFHGLSFLRWIIFSWQSIASLSQIKSPSLKVRLAEEGFSRSEKWILFFSKALSYVLGYHYQIKFLSFFSEIMLFRRDLRKIIQELFPDTLLLSASTFSFDRTIVASCRGLAINKVSMIHSWDNATSKSPPSIYGGTILVWNELQATDIRNLLGSHSPPIQIIGIPFIESLLSARNYADKRSFCCRNHLDPNRPILTYTTGNPRLIPDEPEFIRLVARVLPSYMQLLIRIHPQDSSSRYHDITQECNAQIESIGVKGIKTYDGACFDHTDLKHYAETLTFSSAIVNIASTVSIDALAMETPVINIAFDVTSKNPANSVTRFYHHQHMQHLINTRAIFIASNELQLKSHILKILDESERIGRIQMSNASVLFGPPGISPAKRLVENLIPRS